MTSTFSRVLDVLNDDNMLRAIEYYSDFVRDIHTEEDQIPPIVLSNINNVIENPPSLNIFSISGVFNSAYENAGKNKLDANRMEVSVLPDTTDWDITLDNYQVNCDVGTVEETEENGNRLGPYEIVNASDVESHDPPTYKEEPLVHELGIQLINI